MYSDLEVPTPPHPPPPDVAVVYDSAITLIRLICVINSICISFRKWYGPVGVSCGTDVDGRVGCSCFSYVVVFDEWVLVGSFP